MSDKLVSVDEFLNARKDFVKGTGVLVKAAKAPASWDEEKRSARFTMSAEVEDRDRDIIFQAGLNIDEFLKNPIAPFQHNSYTFPVGSWTDVAKNLAGRPKRTEGTLVLVPEGTEEVADRLAKHIAAGTIRACSIGFVPKSVKRREVPEDKRDSYYYPGYEVLEAELVECSPVTIPANPAALAKSAAKGDVLARETIEEILDTWTKTGTGLVVPKASLEQSHKDATGNRTVVVVVGGGDFDTKAIEEAVHAVVAKQSQEAVGADAGAQTQADDATTQDDASATPPVTIDADKIVSGTVAHQSVPTVADDKKASIPVVAVGEDKKTEAKGLFQKALDLLFGAEANQALIEQQAREQSIADAEKAAAEASVKEAVSTKLADLERRLGAKGLAI